MYNLSSTIRVVGQLEECTIYDTRARKDIYSKDYNLTFDKRTGYTEVWGRDFEYDPDYCPYGPNLADIELSSVVSSEESKEYIDNPNFRIYNGGCTGIGCKQFCYKNNGHGNTTVSMSLAFAKLVLDKLPPTICQIAYGICSVKGCPDLINILNETRRRGIIPNITINGMDHDKDLVELSKVCGAIAVSVNESNKVHAYKTIARLTELGVEQLNIHFVLAEETYDFALKLIKDLKELPQLHGVQALIFLKYKPKNVKCTYHPPGSPNLYARLLEEASRTGIDIGMDSCSAPDYLESIKDHPGKANLAQLVMSCESTRESIYINYCGNVFPCSFMEGEKEWEYGIPILTSSNFVNDIWNDSRIRDFRKKCIACIDKTPPQKGAPCHFFDTK